MDGFHRHAAVVEESLQDPLVGRRTAHQQHPGEAVDQAGVVEAPARAGQVTAAADLTACLGHRQHHPSREPRAALAAAQELDPLAQGRRYRPWRHGLELVEELVEDTLVRHAGHELRDLGRPEHAAVPQEAAQRDDVRAVARGCGVQRPRRVAGLLPGRGERLQGVAEGGVQGLPVRALLVEILLDRCEPVSGAGPLCRPPLGVVEALAQALDLGEQAGPVARAGRPGVARGLLRRARPRLGPGRRLVGLARDRRARGRARRVPARARRRLARQGANHGLAPLAPCRGALALPGLARRATLVEPLDASLAHQLVEGEVAIVVALGDGCSGALAAARRLRAPRGKRCAIRPGGPARGGRRDRRAADRGRGLPSAGGRSRPEACPRGAGAPGRARRCRHRSRRRR